MKANTSSSVVTFDEGYLERLRQGDEKTASHFQDHFRRLLRRWLWGKFSREQEEELVDSAMVTAFEQIRKGQPQNASRLPSYIIGICVNLTRLALRPTFNTTDQDPEYLQIADETRGAEEQLLAQEQAEEVRQVLSSLSFRDREVLLDLFYRELSREEVCQKHGVDREALRLVLFRARKRFQAHWKKSDEPLQVSSLTALPHATA